MSVFVNLGVNSKDDEQLAILEARTKGSHILKNPSLYSVGVNRFKIPIGGIPLFRVYNGDYLFTLIPKNPKTYDATTQNKLKPYISQNDVNFFGMKELEKPYTQQAIFNNTLEHYGIDDKNGKIYRDFYSQEDFCKFLNRGMVRAYNNCLDSPTGTIGMNTQSILIQSPINFRLYTDLDQEMGGGDAVKDLNGYASIGKSTFNRKVVSNEDEDLANASYHEYITKLAVNIPPPTTIFNSTANNQNTNGRNKPPSWENISLWLRRLPVDSAGSKTSLESIDRLNAGDYDNWCLMKNMLGGMEGWVSGTLTDTPTDLSLYLSSDYGMTTCSENRSDKNLRTFYNNHDKTDANNIPTYKVQFDYVVLKDIIGKRADGYEYEFYFINEGSYNQSVGDVDSRPPYYMWAPVSLIKTIISTREMGTIAAIEPISGGIGDINPPTYDPTTEPTDDPLGRLDTNRKLIPYFSYDPSNKKFAWNISNDMLLGQGIDMYMNKKLGAILSFDNYKVDTINSEADMKNYFNVDRTFNKRDEGYIYTFPSNYGNMGVNRNNKSGWWSMCKFEEEMNTEFRRDWLNGLVITSSTLPLEGEIIGDGTGVRKILTDFQSDPTSIGRDYVIFFNTGGMRLYDLNSDEPINDIRCSIQFQDIYGNLRDLIVRHGEECNIKLEFRPNSQLYSLANDISSFDY